MSEIKVSAAALIAAHERAQAEKQAAETPAPAAAAAVPAPAAKPPVGIKVRT